MRERAERRREDRVWEMECSAEGKCSEETETGNGSAISGACIGSVNKSTISTISNQSTIALQPEPNNALQHNAVLIKREISPSITGSQ